MEPHGGSPVRGSPWSVDDLSCPPFSRCLSLVVATRGANFSRIERLERLSSFWIVYSILTFCQTPNMSESMNLSKFIIFVIRAKFTVKRFR
jgi:hypothetical protein